MGVHGRAFMRAFIHACATLLLSLDTRRYSIRPQHELLFLLSLARAAPSLFLNAWRRPLLPSLQVLRLVFETRGSSPGPVVLNTNRRALSCHAQLLFQESCAPFTASRQ